MGLFGRNKKNKTSRIDEAFGRVYRGISHIDSWADPKKLEHYILDSCEQIIATTKEVERHKAEYRVVTAYLRDIKTLNELPPELASEVHDTANGILELEKSLDVLAHTKRNITDEQRLVISEDEAEMPDIINRMTENEKYQNEVKKEMRRLEGEKSRMELEYEDHHRKKRIIKNLAMGTMVIFMSFFILLVVVGQAIETDMSVPYLIVLAGAAASGFILFLAQTRSKKDSVRSVSYLNQTINMLNIARMKYVNVTNGLEYTKDRYHVRTAAELMYVWEQYMESVRDREHYTRKNDDLEFFIGRLERVLDKVDIHDKKIWMTRINALVNPDEMKEVRHRLIERRKAIRLLIDENTRMVQNERDEIDRLMAEHQHYLPEIQEIIKSVDRLCGTSSRVKKD